jgi:hypothetical protein
VEISRVSEREKELVAMERRVLHPPIDDDEGYVNLYVFMG